MYGKHGASDDCQCGEENVGGWVNCVYAVTGAGVTFLQSNANLAHLFEHDQILLA